MIPSQNHQWSVFIVATTSSTFIYYKKYYQFRHLCTESNSVGLRRTSERKAENTNSDTPWYPRDHNRSSRPRSHPLGSLARTTDLSSYRYPLVHFLRRRGVYWHRTPEDLLPCDERGIQFVAAGGTRTDARPGNRRYQRCWLGPGTVGILQRRGWRTGQGCHRGSHKKKQRRAIQPEPKSLHPAHGEEVNGRLTSSSCRVPGGVPALGLKVRARQPIQQLRK